MDRVKKILAVAVAVCAVIASTFICVSAEGGNYDTLSYDVAATVSEDNTIDITEQISVDFTQQSHGIYRNIPYKGTIYREINGESVSKNYRMLVSDISVDGFKYEVYDESGNVVIKIGDEDRMVYGEQVYNIHYKCTLYDDGIDELDMLYWNFLPNYWDSDIQSASLKLTMPKEFDASKVEILSGEYGSVDSSAFTLKVQGNTITAVSNGALRQGEGATVNITLPEGYFVGESSLESLWALVFAIMIIAFAAIFLMWFFVGRDKPVVPVINFYPPDGMTSAEIGYIIDGIVNDRDLVSLIIYWADKGYISIESTGKKDFKLHKKTNLPKGAKPYERTMFNGLFKGVDTVSSDSLSDSFYTKFEASKSMLGNYFKSKMGNNLYTEKSVVARIISYFLCLIPAAAAFFGGVYISAASDGYHIVGFALLVATIASLVVASHFFDARNADAKHKSTLKIGFFTLIYALLSAALAYMTYSSSGNLPASIISFSFSLAGFVFTLRMKTLSERGLKLRGEVIGFKQFIESAELDKLEALVEETPDYFYSVLPYAYALGLTDKWAKKFEKIAVEPPKWYINDYGGSPFSTMIFLNS
ncbi:MAG: DUF2207 domain-containing protein, partial [Clostridia bacterium]|nr:DUF2207 domain-containing protein [Clostridia bacterium]